MTFKSPIQLGALISVARFRLGRVIFGGPTQLGVLVAMTRLRIGLVPFAARLARINFSARTLIHTAVMRDFSIVSSASRLRLGLVIVAARLGRIISARHIFPANLEPLQIEQN